MFKSLFNKIVNQAKTVFMFGFKYGKWLGILWFGSMLIIAPIIYFYFGWTVLLAYLICKFSGVCPL